MWDSFIRAQVRRWHFPGEDFSFFPQVRVTACSAAHTHQAALSPPCPSQDRAFHVTEEGKGKLPKGTACLIHAFWHICREEPQMFPFYNRNEKRANPFQVNSACCSTLQSSTLLNTCCTWTSVLQFVGVSSSQHGNTANMKRKKLTKFALQHL